MGLVRNLKSEEIVSQVIHAIRLVNDEEGGLPPLTNIVFMGMGDAGVNVEAVIESCEVRTKTRIESTSFIWSLKCRYRSCN